jgi:hypothetical protein
VVRSVDFGQDASGYEEEVEEEMKKKRKRKKIKDERVKEIKSCGCTRRKVRLANRAVTACSRRRTCRSNGEVATQSTYHVLPFTSSLAHDPTFEPHSCDEFGGLSLHPGT